MQTDSKTTPSCRRCKWALSDAGAWGPDHRYCGNQQSVWHTYLTPDADRCDHFEGQTNA